MLPEGSTECGRNETTVTPEFANAAGSTSAELGHTPTVKQQRPVAPVGRAAR